MFLARFGLRCVDVPSDGHCFISCLRLYFSEFLPNVVGPTLDTLRARVNELDFAQLAVASAHTEAQLRNDANVFCETGKSATDFVDLFIGLRHEIFSIPIIVLFEAQDGRSFRVDNPSLNGDETENPFGGHTVIVFRQAARQHYKLIVPANRQMLQSIESFIVPEPAAAVVEVPVPVPVEAAQRRVVRRRRRGPCLTDRGERVRSEARAEAIRERRRIRRANRTEEQIAEDRRRSQLNAAACRRREMEDLPTFAIALTFGEIDESSELHVELYLGPMDKECSSCGAFHFEAERTGKSTNFTMCCMKGKVHVPPFSEPPAALLLMFNNRNDPLYKEFMKNIIKYNNGYATASAVANTVVLQGNGPPAYKVHGQMIRRMSTLRASDGRVPCYGQYFTLDTDVALNQRMNHPANHDCKREVNLGFDYLALAIDVLNQVIERIFFFFKRCLKDCPLFSMSKQMAPKSIRSWLCIRECTRLRKS